MLSQRRQILRALVSTSALGAVSLSGAGRVIAAATSTSPIIAAASSLRFALSDALAAFSSRTSMSLRLTFGSSGNFSRQIRQGAPFDLFLSSDEAYVRDLARDGFTIDGGVLYALGQLTIFAPEGSLLRVDKDLTGLKRALERGDIQRFAIANPDHAPYGRAAREALVHAGLWGAIEPHLVLGENVSQAAQFIVSGSCEGGMIARSLALTPGIAGRGSAETVPAQFHQPLRQRMVLLAGADGVARAFYQFLQSATARKIFDRHGFAEPEAE